MKVHVQVSSTMIGGNRYTAFIDYFENGEARTHRLMNRNSLRWLFKQTAEMFGDKLEELYSAKITGEFEEELFDDDLLVWETPIREVLKMEGFA